MIYKEKELRLAQQDLIKAGRALSSAGLRLSGTEFESEYRIIWNKVRQLNNRLINTLKK